MGENQSLGASLRDRAVVPSASSPQAVSPVPASIPSALMLEIYRAGIRRGIDEESAFDRGYSPSGKWYDDLVDAVHSYRNERRRLDDPVYQSWESVKAEVMAWIAEEKVARDKDATPRERKAVEGEASQPGPQASPQSDRGSTMTEAKG